MMWLAYARAGKELEAQEALAEIGIKAECAKVVEVKRVGKRRKPDVFIRPMLPNYLFVTCTDDEFFQVISTKNIASTMVAVPPRDRPSVTAFLAKAQADFDRNMAKIAAGERVVQFAEGDVLEVLSGPLAGLTARFRGIVEHDLFPSVKAEVEIMGRTVKAQLDVLDVARAK